MSPHRSCVILDVDTGVDDAIALALAVQSRDICLAGVTTVAGNVARDLVVENTLRVLAWLGARDVPVYVGAAAPLVGHHRHAAHFHGDDGLGGGMFPASNRIPETVTAPEFIVQSARESPGELDLVFVGPLTNLAIALMLEPALPSLVRQTVIMGGAFLCPGNTTPFAEFNIYADPESASRIAASDLDALWVGLDVTRQGGLTRSEWDALSDATGAAPTLVREVSRRAFIERGADEFHLHDPMALMSLLDPDIVQTERWAIDVDLSTRETAGRTRLVRDPSAPQHRVALGLDAAAFRERLDDTLDLRR
jgi:inosine-uridine nucleoside N-ribohydrolase